MLSLRRPVGLVIVSLFTGLLASPGTGGHAEAQAPPQPSDEVGVTDLGVPDDSGFPMRMMLTHSGKVIATRFTEASAYVWNFSWWNPVSHLWEDGEVTRLGEPYTNVNDISERGYVVGGVWEPDGGPDRPFLWFDGEETTLPIGDASWGEALAVNDRGTVAGATYGPDGYQAVVWHEGEALTPPVDLPPEASSLAVDINNRNQVVLAIGEDETDSGVYTRLMLWEVGGEVIELGEGLEMRELWFSFLTDKKMNERGMVLLSGVTADGGSRSFLWHDGELTDLGSLGGGSTMAMALNEWGQVVGASYDAAGNVSPFLWYQGEMTELDIPVDDVSHAVAINNWGQVVVSVLATVDEGSRVFLWQNGRTLDLGGLVEGVEWWADPVTSPYSLGINDAGQIVGAGRRGSSLDSAARFVMWEVSPLWGYPDGL